MSEIEQKDKIIKIIEMFFPNAKIYLFGSYAKGTARRGSDIDIAIDIGERMPLTQKGQIRSMIDVLNLIQNVDVVDFYAAPPELKNEILKHGILWKN